MTIFEAVEAGDLKELESLIAGGVDVNARSDSGLTALHAAAGRGDLDAALALLDAGADPEARSLVPASAAPATPPDPGGTVADLSTREGVSAAAGLFGMIWEASKPKGSAVQWQTPLIDAAAGGHAGVVRLLLDRGADVNARDGEGYTALTFAVATGRRDMLELLIARGADPEAKTRDGLTPLMLAAQDGRLGFVRTLLDAGADPNASSTALMFTLSPLSLAVRKGHHAVAEALISAGAMAARTPLETGLAPSKAVKENRLDVVRALLDAGADVNSRAGGGDLLHAAAERGHVEMIRVLLKAGADPEARKSFRGTTPLMVAAEHGRDEAVAALLAAGANVHAPVVQDAILSNHVNGSTALVLAARAGHAGVVRSLLAAGAGRDAADAEGRTAAELAAGAGHDEVAAVLAGAGTTTPALRGARLAGAAAEGDAARVVVLLRDGADPEATGRLPDESLSRPALSLAATRGHLDAVVALLAGGASVDARTPIDGQTALMLAASAGHAPVVRALLGAGADPNARAGLGWQHGGKTALILAAEGGHVETAHVLLLNGASVHVKDEFSLWDRERGPTAATALAYAFRVENVDPDLVSMLLDAGAYPDARDEKGGTPLIQAVIRGSVDLVGRLLSAGADADSTARDVSFGSALEAAAMNDDATVYRLLRDAGAVPARHAKLPECLQFAVFQGTTSVVDELLADGVDVDAVTSHGVTALTTAAMMGRLESARKLLDRGADPGGGVPGSDRPLHRAAAMGHVAIVRLLLDSGADPDAPGSGGFTPLMALAREGGRMPIGNSAGLADCARALLAAGADVHALADGRTALEVASGRDFESLAAVLRDAASGRAS